MLPVGPLYFRLLVDAGWANNMRGNACTIAAVRLVYITCQSWWCRWGPGSHNMQTHHVSTHRVNCATLEETAGSIAKAGGAGTAVSWEARPSDTHFQGSMCCFEGAVKNSRRNQSSVLPLSYSGRYGACKHTSDQDYY